jgi:hypothetical protein
MHQPTRLHPPLLNRSPLPFLLAAPLLFSFGCSVSGHAPEIPVPASEPRAVVRLRVDLLRAQDCEEAFDLALYRSRAIELVAWEPGSSHCAERTLTVRYLTRRASREDVLRAAAEAGAKITPLPDGDSR